MTILAAAKRILLILLCLTASHVHAGAGWTKTGNVVELVPTSRHYYEFRLSVTNSSGCDDKDWYYQNYTTRGAQQMFETLLEAVKAGLRVRVYVTGLCNLEGYSEISSVSVSPL
jgi:hypothetical protein